MISKFYMLSTAFVCALLLSAQLASATSPVKVAIHVDEDNVKTMNMALNNAKNISKYYTSKNQDVIIEIVTYGPGLHMLRSDTSPVKDRISTMALEYDNITFSACLNTVQAMKQKLQKDVPLVNEAQVVDSGAVRLMELQFDGYAYLRP